MQIDSKNKQGSSEAILQPLASSSFINEGYDREMQVTIGISEGEIPLSKNITIINLGLREPFLQKDGTDFLDSSNQSFGVLKEK